MGHKQGQLGRNDTRGLYRQEAEVAYAVLVEGAGVGQGRPSVGVE